MELSLRMFRSRPSCGNFRLIYSTQNLSFGNFRLASFAWELSFGILRLETLALETFAWKVTLGNFSFGTSAFFRLGTSALNLSLGNFSLVISAWDFSTGNFSLGSSNWDLWLGISGLGLWAWGTKLRRLGEPAGGNWWNFEWAANPTKPVRHSVRTL